MPLRLRNRAAVFVNPPDQFRGAEPYACALDDENRMLGYVTKARECVRLVPEEVALATATDDVSLASSIDIRTERAIHADVVIPFRHPTFGGTQIEGSGFVANLYTTANTTSMDVTWTTWLTNSTATTYSNEVWNNWYALGQTTTAATLQIRNFWAQWNTNDNTYRVTTPQPARVPTQEELDEHRRRVEAQAEVFRREAEERQARYEAATARARELLLETLDDEQTEEWRKHERFRVRVPDGKRGFRTFRLHHQLAGGVVELDEKGKPKYRYCVHLTRHEPVIDTLVAQKLMLETDLPRFEQLANRSLA